MLLARLLENEATHWWFDRDELHTYMHKSRTLISDYLKVWQAHLEMVNFRWNPHFSQLDTRAQLAASVGTAAMLKHRPCMLLAAGS